MVKTLRLKFGQDLEAKVWSRFQSWRSLVQIVNVFIKIGVSYFGERTEPLNPLCLWQLLISYLIAQELKLAVKYLSKRYGLKDVSEMRKKSSLVKF